MNYDSDIARSLSAGSICPDTADKIQAERNASPPPTSPPVPPPEPSGISTHRAESPSADIHPVFPAPLAHPKQPSEPPPIPLPKVAAYIPYSPTGDLGGEMNRIMERLDDDEWAVFLDHDAMILHNSFWDDLAHAIQNYPSAGAIVTWTNRTGNAAQRAKSPKGDDIIAHTDRARAIRTEYGRSISDITSPQMTGVCFATSRRAWILAGTFSPGFGEVDNTYARQLQTAGLRIYRLDGQYIYHQRRTNSYRGLATKPDIRCRQATWLWRSATPLIRAHAPAALNQLLDAHERTIETRTDWTECQKNARRRHLLDCWRAAMRITVVIPAREEPPAELAATVASFREAGTDQIIVVDDATTDPITPDCGADQIIRHDTARGPAPCRNAGLAAAAGNIIVFSDSHCRITPGSALTSWAFQALCSDDLLSAATGSYENPEALYYGCSLHWKLWRFDLRANRSKTLFPHAPFGSVYAASRWTWRRIGGWVPTSGWGYNEQALGLACHHACVRIRVDPEFRITHKFRTGKNRNFPYSPSGIDFAANAPWTHWLLFEPATWASLFDDPTSKHSPHGYRRWRQRVTDHGAVEKNRYNSLKRKTDSEIFHAIGAKNLLPSALPLHPPCTPSASPTDSSLPAPPQNPIDREHS